MEKKKYTVERIGAPSVRDFRLNVYCDAYQAELEGIEGVETVHNTPSGFHFFVDIGRRYDIEEVADRIRQFLEERVD